MTITINYMKLHKVVESEDFLGPLDDAKSMAKEAVETQTFDRAEIRGADGALLYHFPRTLRAG